MRTGLPALLLSLTLLSFSGCLLLPFAESASELIASPSYRVAKLQETVKGFHQDVYWGLPQTGMTYAEPALRPTLLQSFSGVQNENRKVVDIRVLDIAFNADQTEATVDSLLRYFRVASHVVQVEKKREQWRFGRFTGGWRLERVETLPLDPSQERELQQAAIRP